MNNVNLIGRITKELELKKTPSNLSVVTFTLAVNSTRKNDKGEYIADFIPCTAWRQTAEFMAKYLTKGSLISVEGALQTSSFEHNGEKRFRMDVVANNVQSLEPKKKEETKDTFNSTPSVAIQPDDLPFY